MTNIIQPPDFDIDLAVAIDAQKNTALVYAELQIEEYESNIATESIAASSQMVELALSPQDENSIPI